MTIEIYIFCMVTVVSLSVCGFREVVLKHEMVRFAIVIMQVIEWILARKPLRYFSGFV